MTSAFAKIPTSVHVAREMRKAFKPSVAQKQHLHNLGKTCDVIRDWSPDNYKNEREEIYDIAIKFLMEPPGAIQKGAKNKWNLFRKMTNSMNPEV